jgi:hypothetical protein
VTTGHRSPRTVAGWSSRWVRLTGSGARGAGLGIPSPAPVALALIAGLDDPPVPGRALLGQGALARAPGIGADRPHARSG